MCLRVFVAVREGYDGVSSTVVTYFACYDSHCEWGPTVGLMRK